MARLLGQLSSYDPRTAEIRLRRGATHYDHAHESTHRAQHDAQTLAWRTDQRLSRVPYLGRWSRLWVEWEAMRLAWAAMRLCGLPVDRAEGLRHWLTYLLAAIVPWL